MLKIGALILCISIFIYSFIFFQIKKQQFARNFKFLNFKQLPVLILALILPMSILCIVNTISVVFHIILSFFYAPTIFSRSI